MRSAWAPWFVWENRTLKFSEATPVAGQGRVTGFNRNFLIAGSVILLHVAALWALNTGLLRRAVEVLVPVQMLSEIVEPPQPVPPPPPPELPKPVAAKQAPVRTKVPTPPSPPQILAVPNPAPAPNAPTAVVAPPAPLPPVAEPVAVAEAPAPAPPAPPPPQPAPPKIEPPSSDAEYLRNPLPAYPTKSKELMEQGTVLVEVIVGVDGTVKKVELKKSSGFDRLDRTALSTAMKWRFIPGKRAGVPTEMPYNVPFVFELN